MTDKIRIGVIGVRLGRWHVESFGQVPDAEVAALCDLDGERLAAVQAEFHVPRTYVTIDELLADAELDAVSVCLPNFLHADAVVKALRAGKHVLVEKPLARTVAEGEAIVEAMRHTGLQVMVAMKFRFTPEAAYLKRHIEAGHLGRVYYGWNRYLRPVGKGIPGRWFCRRELSGGGTLIDNGVHLLDVTWHLMGHPEPVEVLGACYAEFGPRGKGTPPEDVADFDVEDFAAGMIRFADGSSILLDNAWAAHVADTQIAASVFGIEGAGSVWPFQIVEERDGKSSDVTPSKDDLPVESQFAHFVRSIRDGTPNASPAEQGLVVLRMLEAIEQSARSGRSVRIEPGGTPSYSASGSV